MEFWPDMRRFKKTSNYGPHFNTNSGLALAFLLIMGLFDNPSELTTDTETLYQNCPSDKIVTKYHSFTYSHLEDCAL